MRFLSIYKTAERGVTPSEEEIRKMGKLIEDGMREGWLLATEGCLPGSPGSRVRLSAGKLIATDGTFAETKEVVGGFAILRTNSREEAIELTKRFLHVVGEGECELRELCEAVQGTGVQKAAKS